MAIINTHIEDWYNQAEVEPKFRKVQIRPEWLNVTTKEKDIVQLS